MTTVSRVIALLAAVGFGAAAAPAAAAQGRKEGT